MAPEFKGSCRGVLFTPVFLLIFVVAITGGDGDPTSAIDPDREQLFKDALGWMTFKKNGELMEEADLEPLFLLPIVERYLTSKFYRTFVIAFQQGVLPRMTLNEDDPCDPSYTLEYKDPFNNSVTWFYQKKFTFDAFDQRNSGGIDFCDYRQGLICKPSTKTCRCPADSSMQSISSTSHVKRCLIEKDKVCSLIDVAHGNDPEHSVLASNLHHLIFNPEKPLSCAPGTQCRFKEDNKNTPLCYEPNHLQPWYPLPPKTDNNGDQTFESWDLLLGDECALGLYADPGSCKSKSYFEGPGLNPGLVCYNFGPPQSLNSTYPGTESRTGFCFYEFGVYGLAYQQLKTSQEARPLFGTFVTPRTVPLRGEELRNFYQQYVNDVVTHFDNADDQYAYIEAVKEGERCSVGKTKTMEEAWEYFSSLGEAPPLQQDYVEGATKEELESHLQSVIELKDNPDLKVCKVYWDYEKGDPRVENPSLRCNLEPPTDDAGNDGTCQPFGISTVPYAEKLQEFIEFEEMAREAQDNEEVDFREDILEDNLDPPCVPSLGLLPSQAVPEEDPDFLEDGHCPVGSVCYQDFSSAHARFDDQCNLVSEEKEAVICHDVLKELEECEDKYLEGKVQEALASEEVYATLKEGEPCDRLFELSFRGDDNTRLSTANKYQLLNWLGGNIMCDRDLGLECLEDGVCECTGKNCKKEDEDDGGSEENGEDAESDEGGAGGEEDGGGDGGNGGGDGENGGGGGDSAGGGGGDGPNGGSGRSNAEGGGGKGGAPGASSGGGGPVDQYDSFDDDKTKAGRGQGVGKNAKRAFKEAPRKEMTLDDESGGGGTWQSAFHLIVFFTCVNLIL